MKPLLKKTIYLLPMLLVLMLGVTTPVIAAISQTILTENIFLTAEKGFYNESLQAVLVEQNSPLSDYSETLSGNTASAAEIIWMGSQTIDYGINPKVLLVNLKVLGWLDQTPTEKLTPFVQSMTASLWEGYTAYKNGTRTVTLHSGTTVQISNSNSATFTLAYYLAADLNTEAELSALLLEWKTAYQEIFTVDPSIDKDPVGHAITDVVPFLHLPFAHSGSNMILVNSFFDHSIPGTFDNSILRFDGQTISSASFSTCALGVSCYGGHNGIDYKTGAGMPILAAASGTVVYKYYNTDSSAGTVDSGLYIDHDNGYRTAYWHMDPISVEYGQKVAVGDLIGYSGNIGQSSGAHLHFALRMVDKSKSVDPYGWWSNSVGDYWGDSKWMWNGNLIADMGESQTQLFNRSYWYPVNSGYNNNSFWTYEVSSSSSSTNWATWGAYIETPGKYNVYAYWPKDSANTHNARYKIFHSAGTNTVSVDQSANGDQFVLLGTYTFNKGSTLVYMNDYTGASGGKVRFDAVKWVLSSSVTSTSTATPLPTATSTPTAAPTSVSSPDSGDERINLALGKKASQSSQFGADPIRGKPGLAVDGNTDGNYNNSSVSHTKNEITPWWQVDLGSVQNISQVSVWNRTDCCSTRLSDFYVLVSDVPFTSTSLSTTLKQSGVSVYFFAGAASKNTNFDIGRTGRYIRIQLKGTNYLSLAEVQVWSDGTTVISTPTPIPTSTQIVTSLPDPSGTSTSNPTTTATALPSATSTPTATPTSVSSPDSGGERINLAQGKKASQSSQFGADPIRGKPGLAVDGNTDGNYNNSSVSHTKNQITPWWQVDLGSIQYISQISIWNRTDCCSNRLSNFYVLVSNVPFTSTSLSTTLKQSGVSAYFFAGAASKNTNFDIGRTGRYVRIQLKGTNYLSLAEVQVWTDGTAIKPTSTPTPTPLVVTPNPSATYKKQIDYPYYTANFAHPTAGNSWFGVAGQIFNEYNMPVNQIVVVVKGTLNGVAFEKSTQTGLNTDYGPGGYEIVLGTAPAATTSNLNITLYSLSGTAVSSTYYFDTYKDVSKNLVLINFEKK